MIIEIQGTCHYEGCSEKATHLACGRNRYYGNEGHPIPSCYCEAHAIEVADENSPEYTVECPNCDCKFGVN